MRRYDVTCKYLICEDRRGVGSHKRIPIKIVPCHDYQQKIRGELSYLRGEIEVSISELCAQSSGPSTGAIRGAPGAGHYSCPAYQCSAASMSCSLIPCMSA